MQGIQISLQNQACGNLIHIFLPVFPADATIYQNLPCCCRCQLERTRVNGTEYLLATQELNQDSEGYIFKVISEQRDENDEETLELELVEDETEMVISLHRQAR